MLSSAAGSTRTVILALSFLWWMLIPTPVTAFEGQRPKLETPPQRIVALNWAATEALLLLGVTPIGVADMEGYRTWVKEPRLPDEVVNVGRRTSPNLEAVAQLMPDLIVSSGDMRFAAAALRKIAPTYAISIYENNTDPYQQASEMLLALGEMLDRKPEAVRILEEIDNTFRLLAESLATRQLSQDPVALVSFLDDRHVRVYSQNGMFQSTLAALNLENAWPQAGNRWGFSVTGLDALSKPADVRLVVIAPIAENLPPTLAESPFWLHLPAVKNSRVYQLETVWPFGGVYQAKRLARYLTEALMAGGSRHLQ